MGVRVPSSSSWCPWAPRAATPIDAERPGRTKGSPAELLRRARNLALDHPVLRPGRDQLGQFPGAVEAVRPSSSTRIDLQRDVPGAHEASPGGNFEAGRTVRRHRRQQAALARTAAPRADDRLPPDPQGGCADSRTGPGGVSEIHLRAYPRRPGERRHRRFAYGRTGDQELVDPLVQPAPGSPRQDRCGSTSLLRTGLPAGRTDPAGRVAAGRRYRLLPKPVLSGSLFPMPPRAYGSSMPCRTE